MICNGESCNMEQPPLLLVEDMAREKGSSIMETPTLMLEEEEARSFNLDNLLSDEGKQAAELVPISQAPTASPVSRKEPDGLGKAVRPSLGNPHAAMSCDSGAERQRDRERDICPELPLLTMQKVVQPKVAFCHASFSCQRLQQAEQVILLSSAQFPALEPSPFSKSPSKITPQLCPTTSNLSGPELKPTKQPKPDIGQNSFSASYGHSRPPDPEPKPTPLQPHNPTPEQISPSNHLPHQSQEPNQNPAAPLAKSLPGSEGRPKS